MMSREVASATLHVDLEALANNYHTIRKIVGNEVAVAPVVKANSYGLGARGVVQALSEVGAKEFFVAHLSEALDLVNTVGAIFYVLHGISSGEEEYFLNNPNIIPVLNSSEQVSRWNNCGKKNGTKLPGLLHFDTGMNRLGLSEQDLLELDHIEIVSIMSHLACADEPDSGMNLIQLEKFRKISKHYSKARCSLANSAGIVLGKDYHFDMVRPGIALYGVSPLPIAASVGTIQNVATLKAKVIQIKEISPGETIGYGASYTAAQPMKIATVGLGYADGYMRILSNRGVMAYGEHRLAVLGRISMDLVVLDVSVVPEFELRSFDEVEVFGNNLPITLLADLCQTLPYEILTSLGRNCERILRLSR